MTTESDLLSSTGLVVIGRNEGERLRQCLASLNTNAMPVVYVDSGSTDGSVELARAMNVHVVELPSGRPFTAARARNAGFERLLSVAPDLRLVQFVDGDCTLDTHWFAKATAAMEKNAKAAVICGRRRERFPDASIFNRLCDLEWETPIGPATECGGDALMRVDAFRSVGGFDDRLIAGEEPELCVRLRTGGWEIERIDAEMTLHDANMSRFSQWWNRNVRAGHAFAEGSSLHGRSPAKHWNRQTRSNWVWGIIIPVIGLALAWPMRGISLLFVAMLELLLVVKIYLNTRRRGLIRRDASLYAVFCVIGKIPQAIGQSKYWIAERSGKRTTLIEYKNLVSEITPSA